jgi:hypothetical protein
LVVQFADKGAQRTTPDKQSEASRELKFLFLRYQCSLGIREAVSADLKKANI